MSQELDELKREIAALKRGSQNGKEKPHKLLMLLAVLDLADDGLLQENRIDFDTALIERFQKQFSKNADSTDWYQPGPPFFHLRSSSFWRHQIKAGREKEYATLTTSGGGVKRIHDNIEYSMLSPDVFALVSNAATRNNLRNFIVSLLDNPKDPD
jgi:predicted restriction endonuclease